MTTRRKSDSPVAAREALDQEQASPDVNLEQQAKEQERQQSRELGQSLSGAAAKGDEKLQKAGLPAAARAGAHAHAPVRGGFMDQLSRRSDEDALEGHFVKIDLKNKGVTDAFEQVGLKDHRGDYGVYLEPASRDPETGVPETAIVRLRDDTNARVTVPYEALSPAVAGGR
jgi:hypothetical protein